MQPKRALDPAAIVKGVLAKRPDLKDARLRYDDDRAVYFCATRGGMAISIPVYASMVLWWGNAFIVTEILQELRKC